MMTAPVEASAGQPAVMGVTGLCGTGVRVHNRERLCHTLCFAIIERLPEVRI